MYFLKQQPQIGSSARKMACTGVSVSYSDEAREFHAEASRLQTNLADSSLPQNSQGFLAWAPVLVIQPHMDDGRARSAGVQEQSQSETSTSRNKINVQLLRLIHNMKLLLYTYSKIHNHSGSVLQKR